MSLVYPDIILIENVHGGNKKWSWAVRPGQQGAQMDRGGRESKVRKAQAKTLFANSSTSSQTEEEFCLFIKWQYLSGAWGLTHFMTRCVHVSRLVLARNSKVTFLFFWFLIPLVLFCFLAHLCFQVSSIVLTFTPLSLCPGPVFVYLSVLLTLSSCASS